MNCVRSLLALLFSLWVPSAQSADPGAQTTVKLILSHETVRPGDTVVAGPYEAIRTLEEDKAVRKMKEEDDKKKKEAR